ncbi:MAG: M48 family metalloprotease [Burkholderiales bacterium]|nr:M48 family metalloprotease [Burkholderiales bacterium]
MSLVYKNEPRLFALSLVLSSIFWIVLVLGTLGIALIYMLGLFILYLFAHSAFISRLRGSAVRISPEQFPDLNAQISKCCGKLGISPQPEAYLMHAGGSFNALATRFLGDNFIVLYSDIVDALEDNPDAIAFYVGHELGHIHRKHLQWGPFLWPSGMLPLLGAAYSRAREYTCDLYGLHCSGNTNAAAQGLIALSAGHRRWRTAGIRQYAEQASETGGFWMSFHELISDYPWLTKRVARIAAPHAAGGIPGRNALAWLFALFVPRLGIGGGIASVMIFVAILGILAAIAIPQYQDYVTRVKLLEVVAYGENLAHSVGEHIEKTNRIPDKTGETMAGAGLRPTTISDVSIADDNAVIRIVISAPPVRGKSILFIPSRGPDRRITWRCASEDIAARLLPPRCRPPAETGDGR